MIHERDIEELFIRSSGPGGQNVNKVSTCVVLRHRPTGIMVKCREFRTQYQNRARARELLALELERRASARQQAWKAAREKRRRQSRGRSTAGKEKVLEQKRRSSFNLPRSRRESFCLLEPAEMLSATNRKTISATVPVARALMRNRKG